MAELSAMYLITTGQKSFERAMKIPNVANVYIAQYRPTPDSEVETYIKDEDVIAYALARGTHSIFLNRSDVNAVISIQEHEESMYIWMRSSVKYGNGKFFVVEEALNRALTSTAEPCSYTSIVAFIRSSSLDERKQKDLVCKVRAELHIFYSEVVKDVEKELRGVCHAS